ncbi:MAG: hypothetical protein LBT86_07300 [Deltaproteobacteria bacterium]|jgi:hypothetical protein|nr:hypothetical protein [Deltaproteobacteria bacterium]
MLELGARVDKIDFAVGACYGRLAFDLRDTRKRVDAWTVKPVLTSGAFPATLNGQL